MSQRVLIYGFGNPGRLDDGLGPALARDVADRLSGDAVTVESSYQLQIEDAVLVAEHDVVIFVDAHTSCAAPFSLRRMVPRRSTQFTTHALAPDAVLALARDQFHCDTEGFVLGIRGYEFRGFGEGLSSAAKRNLTAATDYVYRTLRDGSFARDAVAAQRER